MLSPGESTWPQRGCGPPRHAQRWPSGHSGTRIRLSDSTLFSPVEKNTSPEPQARRFFKFTLCLARTLPTPCPAPVERADRVSPGRKGLSGSLRAERACTAVPTPALTGQGHGEGPRATRQVLDLWSRLANWSSTPRHLGPGTCSPDALESVGPDGSEGSAVRPLRREQRRRLRAEVLTPPRLRPLTLEPALPCILGPCVLGPLCAGPLSQQPQVLMPTEPQGGGGSAGGPRDGACGSPCLASSA